MTNNDKTTHKCYRCRMSYTMSTDTTKQYNFQVNGFCSYTCMADQDDDWNYQDRYLKP